MKEKRLIQFQYYLHSRLLITVEADFLLESVSEVNAHTCDPTPIRLRQKKQVHRRSSIKCLSAGNVQKK